MLLAIAYPRNAVTTNMLNEQNEQMELNVTKSDHMLLTRYSSCIHISIERIFCFSFSEIIVEW